MKLEYTLKTICYFGTKMCRNKLWSRQTDVLLMLGLEIQEGVMFCQEQRVI